MQITHEEAHQLIQLNTDHALPSAKKEMLDSHLKHCSECSSYQQEIAAVGNTLQLTMQKHWNIQPRHLDVQVIKAKSKSINPLNNIVPARGALVAMMVMVFVFASWQLVARTGKSGMLVTNLAPIPTPSLLLTGTSSNLNNCQKSRYEVQRGDTLESLAQQFSVSGETLVELNNLQAQNIRPGMKLVVLICDPTPTRTSGTPTSTTTPIMDPISYTPG